MKNKLICILLSVFCQSSYAYTVIQGKNGHKFHTGLRHGNGELFGKMHVQLEDCGDLPDSFDLRDLGTVPPVRDQGGCGSCWSFSKTASLESAVLAAGGKPVDLSEQELVSCDKSQWGCMGGLLTDFEYQIEHGQGLEKDYGYTSGNSGRTGSCKGQPKVAAKGTSFAYIGAPNRYPTDKELKCALYKSHTVPWIVVSATNAWGRPPASYKTPYAGCRHGQTNHAVGVVGWFKDGNGKSQFIMKNSWGKGWGDQGYMSMPLGCDSFGEEAAYVLTEKMPCKVPMVKLASEITAQPGVEVPLGVKEQSGVEYTWYAGSDNQEIGKGAVLFVTVEKEMTFKLVGKNTCATSESSVKVKVSQ